MIWLSGKVVDCKFFIFSLNLGVVLVLRGYGGMVDIIDLKFVDLFVV